MCLEAVTHHPFFQSIGEMQIINMKPNLGKITVNTLGMSPFEPGESFRFLNLLSSACIFWTLLCLAKGSLNQLYFPLRWQLLEADYSAI